MCSVACWAPPFCLMPKQAGLFGSGVSLESPPEGHLLWDLALITHGSARGHLFHFKFSTYRSGWGVAAEVEHVPDGLLRQGHIGLGRRGLGGLLRALLQAGGANARMRS